MYVYGKFNETVLITPERLAELMRRGREEIAPKLSETPISEIIDALGAAAEQWRPSSPRFRQAMALLPDALSFHPEMIRATLNVIPELLNPSVLRRRIAAELGDPGILDAFIPRPGFRGRVRAFPAGALFHVTAGNVFLGCIDSLLMGFLTKNASIVKLSSRNQLFPRLFAESIRETPGAEALAESFCLIHFPGGAGELETVVKQESSAIIAWGGDEMIREYKRGLAPGVPLLEYGPKISFQVIFGACVSDAGSLDRAALRAAHEIAVWDQAACASPQNLFLQDTAPREAFIDALAGHLQRQAPRGRLSPDEAAEILKEEHRAHVSTFLGAGAIRKGDRFLIHDDPEPGLRPSPLNRTIIMKRFRDIADLEQQVRPHRRFLQSCGRLAPRELDGPLLEALSRAGVRRFTALGEMMNGQTGAPHDGRYSLTELVRFVADETPAPALSNDIPAAPDLLEFINGAIREVPYYHRLMQGQAVVSHEEVPLLTGADIAAHSRASAQNSGLPGGDFRRPGVRGGYVFASGGTTGAPKFTFYANDEFETSCRLLARGYSANGIAKGDIVANLFAAGNMWSSFLGVEKALAFLEAVQLPIGGNGDPEMILDYLHRFSPRAVLGLPTQLAGLAALSREKNIRLAIPLLFYAGEHLNPAARELLQSVWKVETFRSAGYASVDAGPIGYQCAACGPREHHLFSPHVHMEIVEGEAVITSLIRRATPLIRLRAGDAAEFSVSEAPCSCGDPGPKFILLGRCDNQINMWGCRIPLADIESALSDAGANHAIKQILLETTPPPNAEETMTICIESEPQPTEVGAVAEALHRICKDARCLLTPDFLARRIGLRFLPPLSIPRVPRTGKIRLISDLRSF